MAYTSIIPVHRLDNSVDYVLDEKKASRSQNADSLQAAVDYALNKDKTEQDLFCSAIGCTLDSAFEDMCQIKRMWHKEKGVQGFHLVQSFAAGEVTPELAHQIGQELADRLLGGKYQVVISTHLNTGHIHNHLVWNSVSIQTGKKYRSNEKSYVIGVRRISDELCRKYHLSVIDTEKSERVARPYAQWLAEQEGKPTWKTVIQQDVDAAIAASLTWKQFLRVLEQQGYTFRFDRKYMTLKPPGKDRPVRFKTLGKNYTPEAIQRRILYPRRSAPAGKRTPPAHGLLLLLGETQPRKLTGLRALYYSYLYTSFRYFRGWMFLLHLRQNLLGLQPQGRNAGHQHCRHQQNAAHDSYQHKVLRRNDDILRRLAEQRTQGASYLLAGEVGQRESHHRNQHGFQHIL